MKASSMFPSKYLNTDDLGTARPVVVIESLKKEVVGTDKKESKWVMYFRGKEKGLTLNVTNSTTLEELFGDETEDWLRKPIRLYVDPSVMMEGKRVGGIRIEAAPHVVRTPPPPVRHVEPQRDPEILDGSVDDSDVPF